MRTTDLHHTSGRGRQSAQAASQSASLMGHPKLGASWERFATDAPRLTPSIKIALADRFEAVPVGELADHGRL